MARTYLIPFALLFLLKFILAAVFPVFGDEAYYVYWGANPAGGYYDLPPMIGWWLAPLLRISSHPLWIRSLNLLVPVLISFGLYELLLKSKGREQAPLAALLFFALPLPFLTVLSFPDVPLLFFAFFSSLLFFSGINGARRFFSSAIIMSGALFGAAFLSKYFAVFLLPGFVIWAWPRAKNRVGVFLSFFLGAAPFLFQHLLWNERNCRASEVFNLITRQRASDGSSWETTGFFLLHLLVVSITVLPFLRKRRVEREVKNEGLRSFLMLLWLIPVLIFLFTSILGRGQGLHWLLYLTPFFVGWSSFHLDQIALKRAFFSSAFLSVALGAIFCAAFAMPERMLHSRVSARYPLEFSVITGARDFVNQLKNEIQDSSVLMFQSYGLASLFYYEFRRHWGPEPGPEFLVVSSGSRFGRAFDFRVMWPNLQGRTVSIFTGGDLDSKKFAPYFQSLQEKRSFFRGTEYSILTGVGFDSKKFWFEKVLPELEEFYPSWFSSSCHLKEVYRAN